MLVDLILVPYDSGHRGVRMGRGPLHLMEAGAAERLRAGGFQVREITIEAQPGFRTEVGTAFELARALALAVRSATARGSFPLVLAGNCSTALGAVAGLGEEAVGIVWFDAHGDLNTPETTTSGFFDGMTLATLTGRCWTSLAATVGGLRTVPEERVVLVGARDLDAAEARVLAGSRIAQVDPRAGEELGRAVERLGEHAGRVYLHLDLDVLDPAAAQANGYAVPGGPTPGELHERVRAVAGRLPLAAAALTAFDPEHDTGGRTTQAALELVELLATLGHRDRSPGEGE